MSFAHGEVILPSATVVFTFMYLFPFIESRADFLLFRSEREEKRWGFARIKKKKNVKKQRGHNVNNHVASNGGGGGS